jgi:hypothetical protein
MLAFGRLEEPCSGACALRYTKVGTPKRSMQIAAVRSAGALEPA